MKKILKNLLSNTKNTNNSFIKRLIAYFVDWYIISILTILPINLIYSLTFKIKNFDSTISNLPLPQATIAFILGLIFSMFYLIYFPYKHNGQTLGKKILGLKIIKTNHEILDFKTLLIRNGLGLILIEGTFYSCSIYFWELLNIVSSLSISSTVLSILGLISFISMSLCLFSSNHQMLHDMISKTRVVAIQK